MARLSDTIRAIVAEQNKVEEDVLIPPSTDEVEETNEADEETVDEQAVKQDVKAVAKKFMKHREKKSGTKTDKWGQKIKVKEDVDVKQTEENEDIQETAASDTIVAHGGQGASRMAMINDLTSTFSKFEKSDQVDFFNKMMATMKSGQFGEKNTAESNRASIAAKGDAKSARTVAMKEDVAELFGEEPLSEEFKEKASVLFEAAVNARVVEVEAELLEAYEQALDEEMSSLTTIITGQVSETLDDVLESWYEENKIAVESQLRADIMEDFIVGLKNLFKENYIEVPEDKVDVVETLSMRVEELEDQLNSTMSENIQLKNSLLEADKTTVVDEVAEGLTVTQAEKFRTLAEGVTFDGDLESYQKKLNLVKENYFAKTNTKKVNTSSVIMEEVDPNNAPEQEVYIDPQMKRYLETTSRIVKNR